MEVKHEKANTRALHQLADSTKSRIMRTLVNPSLVKPCRYFSNVMEYRPEDLEQLRLANADLEAFERYVSSPNSPDLVGMTNALVLSQIMAMNNPRFRVENDRNCYFLDVVGTKDEFGKSGRAVRIVQDWGTDVKITVRTGDKESAIHLNKPAYNRSDRLEHSKDGILVQAYNIPRIVADIVLRDFTRLEGTRNDVLLRGAMVQDKTECSQDCHAGMVRKSLQMKEDALPGVNDRQVYALEKRFGDISVYGEAHGIKGNDKTISFTMRVRGPRAFVFPSRNHD